MVPLPPLNFTGGAASAKTGDQLTGATGFGDFIYNDAPPYTLIAVVVIAAIAAYLYMKNKS